MQRHAAIIGIGSYLPERRLTNAELEQMVDTSDEWIVSRTGIRERRMIAPDQATSDLATEAARLAMRRAGVEPGGVDLLVLGTTVPDFMFPSAACVTQA